MGESNGRFNGKENADAIARIAAQKAKNDARIARITKHHHDVVEWMKSHVAPEINSIDDYDAIDIIATLVGHVRVCEARIERLELEAKGEKPKEERRIVLP